MSNEPDAVSLFLEPQTPETTEPVEPEEEEPEDVVEEAEVAEAEEEAPDEDAEDDDEADPEPDLYTVTVDGVQRQVTLAELKSGFSGQSSLTKRHNELKAAEDRNRQTFEQLQREQNRFLQLAQQAEQQGFMPPPTPPDPQLIHTDPIGYMTRKAEYDARAQAYYQQQTTIRQAQEQKQAAEKAAFDHYVQGQVQQLLGMIPELADPEKGPSMQRRLIEGAQTYGYTPEELAQAHDARAYAILRDALEYRRLKSVDAKKVAAEAKPSLTPKAKRKEPPQLARGKIIAKAKASGRADDWLQAFMEPKE